MSAEKNIQGKKILVRVDFDVAADADGKIQTPFRAGQQKELIDFLVAQGARVLMISHISAVESFQTIHRQLEVILGRSIVFIPDVSGISPFWNGSAVLALLENTRHWKGEEENDDSFAQQLAEGSDLYVNNAFAVCHRAHASIVAVTKYVPSYAGPLMEEETQQLQKAIDAPAAGKVVAIGGAKASTKLPVVKNFLHKAEHILIGGIVANDILKERGVDIGGSRVDEDVHQLAAGLDIFDTRLVVAEDFVMSDNKVLDIGSQTRERFRALIHSAKMVIWNGPMGLFEDPRFAEGTTTVAKAIAESSALSVIGGGDTISAVEQLGMLDTFDFVSTGGGAMLSFLAGEKLPGLKALGYYG